MIPAATLRATVQVDGVPQGNAKLDQFQKKLQGVSRSSASAKLQADFKGRGFDEFDAKIDKTRAKAARPITQEVKVQYDRSGFSRAWQDLTKLKQAIGGGGGQKGLGPAIGEALTPFGKLGTTAVAASPLILDLSGAVVALSGSLSEAALGAGALAVGAGGAGTVGIAGITAVAIPAITSLKNLKKAQDAYILSVETYGVQSTQAETAAKKLRAVEQMSGKGAIALIKGLDSVKERWAGLTKPGQKNFLGMLDDGLDRVLGKLPLFAKSANSSTAALRDGFDEFLKQAMGPGFNHFVETMTVTFANIVPKLGHSFGDWTEILMRLAVAAAPSLERVVGLFEKWSDKMLASTSDARSLRQDISHLTDQTLSWVHLLTATGNLLVAVFGAGAGQGQRLVDDMTGKLKQWTGWINGHQAATHAFFKRSADTARELSQVLAGFLPTFLQISEAMRPISQAFLGITKALNSIKIGNVSALTALLGAYVALRGAGKIGGALAGAGQLFGTGAATTVEGAAVSGGGAVAAGGAGSGLVQKAGKWFLPVTALIVGADVNQQVHKAVSGGDNPTIWNKLAGAVTFGPVALANDIQKRTRKAEGTNEIFGSLTSELGSSSKAMFQALSADWILGLGALRDDTARGLGAISKQWGGQGHLWREHAAQAMHGTVEAIRQGMDAGVIPVKQGEAEINRLLEKIHILKGTDPFGLAQGAVASFKQAGSITASGIQNLEGILAKLPPKARGQMRNMVEGMLQQWAQGHPKLEHQVDGLNNHIESRFSHANRDVEKSTGEMAESVGRIFGSLATNVNTDLSGILTATQRSLSALGVKNAIQSSLNFSTAYGNLPGSKGQRKQAGGFIVPGAGEGDSFRTNLPPGSFVMNKKATPVFGFQSGGHVPVMLEPGERVFMPGEVQHHGRGALEMANSAVPRFAKGGSIGKEPQLRGPDGALRSLGQEAIHKVFQGAKASLAAHMPKGGGAGGGIGGNFTGNWVKVMQEIAKRKGWSIGDWRSLIMGESGGDPTATNPESGAYGIGQFLGSTLDAYRKYGAASPDPAKQIVAMAHYIADRYSNPTNAYHQWLSRSPHWYAVGGSVERLATGGMVGGSREKWKGWTPDGRWDPSSVHRLISGGEALAIPTTIKATPTAASKATPSKAVQWAMRHLGDSDQWGYPGEWCGAFLGADMEAQGLKPPSGYPSAAAWATYGTPLGKGHIQPGAILDYGSAHVAMAISASQQIQGNNHDGVVGTSEIGGVIGGSGLTAVRWPPYGSGPGAGAAPVEKVPKQVKGAYTKAKAGATAAGGTYGSDVKSHYKVRTDKLPSFGALPSTLEACNKELRIRQRELGEYRAALRSEKQAATKHALSANITLLEARISALRKQRGRLMREAATKKALKKITEAALFSQWTNPASGIFATRLDAYEVALERAEQAVQLEPEEPLSGSTADWVNSALKPYVDSVESPAYARVLGSEAAQRNALIGGEQFAENKIEEWRVGAEKLKAQIDFIRALRESNPQAYAKRKDQIPGMQQQIKALYADIKTTRTTTLPEWEETLSGVQGRHRTHEILGGLPGVPSDKFGGNIFDTQLAIRGLGLKVPQALAGLSEAITGKSATDELTAELLRQANQRTAVAEAQGAVLPGWDAQRQGFAGMFAAGGFIPAGMWGIAGERGPEPVMGPATVVSNRDAQGMFGGGVQVVVNGSIKQDPGDTRPAIEVRDSKGNTIDTVLTATGTGRRHPGSAFATRP